MTALAENPVCCCLDIGSLRERLSEAEETLGALRSGAADALLGESGVVFLSGVDARCPAFFGPIGKDGEIGSAPGFACPQRTAELQLAESVLESTLEGVMVTDTEGVIRSVNPAFAVITGYGVHEAVGRKPNLLRSQRHGPEFYEQIWQALQHDGRWRGEIWNRRRNGELYLQWTRINLIPARDGRPACYVSVFADVTDVWQREEHIAHLAYHDPLTDLPNRALLLDRLSHAITMAERQDTRIGVLFLDLDGFKAVNDRHGHLAGDEVLQEVARRFSAVVRSSDTLARLGGDEFVALMENVRGPKQCAILAEKLAASLDRGIGSRAVPLGVSVGIALYPEDGKNAATLLERADRALYAAKNAGKGVYRFHSPRACV